jgi:hypothetical protein
MMKKRKKLTMPKRGNFTTISLEPETLYLLSQYKEDNDNWDDFLRKVLKLIEEDIKNSEDAY